VALQVLAGSEVAEAQLVVLNGRNAGVAIGEIVQRNHIAREARQAQVVLHPEVRRALGKKGPLQLPVQVGTLAVGAQHHAGRELAAVGQGHAVLVGGGVKGYIRHGAFQVKSHAPG